jgi:hypothetical protein
MRLETSQGMLGGQRWSGALYFGGRNQIASFELHSNWILTLACGPPRGEAARCSTDDVAAVQAARPVQLAPGRAQRPGCPMTQMLGAPCRTASRRARAGPKCALPSPGCGQPRPSLSFWSAWLCWPATPTPAQPGRRLRRGHGRARPQRRRRRRPKEMSSGRRRALPRRPRRTGALRRRSPAPAPPAPYATRSAGPSSSRSSPREASLPT